MQVFTVQRIGMLFIMFLIVFASGVSMAQQNQAIEKIDTKKNAGKHQLHHKIGMINQILFSPTLVEKLRKSGNPSAEKLVARAKVNYGKVAFHMDKQQFLEAGAIIDFILRDITASAQLINVSLQQSKRYKQSVEKFEGLVLPEWKDLTAEEDGLLKQTMEKVGQLKDQAVTNAQSETWSEAAELIEIAYYLKASLMAQLPHDSDIVYDLKFASIEDEYNYMSNRVYHYLELVDLARARNEPNVQTKKLAENYIARSMMNLEAAESMELEGEYSEANAELQKSINQLSTVLKILGVKI